MASTYTPLGIEKMATGENAGTWGTKTNANLDLIEQVLGGYKAVSIAGGAQTTALTVADGALTGTAQARMIEFTGSITGNQVVTIPLDVENFYILKNSYDLQTDFRINSLMIPQKKCTCFDILKLYRIRILSLEENKNYPRPSC